MRAIRLDSANGVPHPRQYVVRKSTKEDFELGTFYPKDWRFSFNRVVAEICKSAGGEGILAFLAGVNASLHDLGVSRRWFAKNTPIERETTWELYKRVDPDGKRAMNQRPFYSLLPKSWREQNGYQKMDAPYQDCVDNLRK